MFIVQALYSFSQAVIIQQSQQQLENKSKQQQQGQTFKKQNDEILKHQIYNQQLQQNEQKHYFQLNNSKQQQQKNKQQWLQKGKRIRSHSQEKQLQKEGAKQQQTQNKQQSEIIYLSFNKGDKILVIQSYQNGWWYGNTLSEPDFKGFFPSNYVQVQLNKPKPPPPPSTPAPDSIQNQQLQVNDSNKQGVDWIQNQLKNINQGPIDSSYYLGIKGYKTIKINQKNQNVLKSNNVKFDVNTGLASVPIKDQAPAAKSVRQMGYYFDYHQWTQQRNKNPDKKARPDIRKKKPKQLKLKGMD